MCRRSFRGPSAGGVRPAEGRLRMGRLQGQNVGGIVNGGGGDDGGDEGGGGGGPCAFEGGSGSKDNRFGMSELMGT